MDEVATPFLAALIVSLVATPVCRSVAHRLGYISKPKEDRWHKKPTALFGGVAIVLGTAAGLGGAGHMPIELWQLTGCGVLIAAFGLVDDVLSLKASTKLIAQIVVASALLFFGFRLHWADSAVADAMLTLFWIVGITNAFNLLDNMDGLCGGVTLIAGGFLLVWLTNEAGASPEVALYLSALIGATAGFLVYNIHPASIFMGDAGSLFIGFNLAALTLLGRAEGRPNSGVLSVVAAPVLLLLIPILDTTLVTTARLMSGRRPSQGGRDHSSHRLVAIGLSETWAVSVLWALAAVSGAVSLLLRRSDTSWSVIVLLMFIVGVIIFAVYLARIRVYADADPAVLRGRVTPLVADFMYKRRVAEVLLDLCLISIAYYTAYRLRFEGASLAPNYPLFLQSLPIVLASQLVALFVVGGYRGTWRYFGMMDAVVFAKGVLLGTVGAELVILYVYRFESYSRSVFVIDGVLLLVLLATTRASFRLIGEFVHRRRSSGWRCAIYGAGGASLATIQEAFGTVPLRIVGFIDDNPSIRHTRVGGYSVLGGFDVLGSLAAAGALDCVVLNTHLLDADRLQELERVCQEANIELLRLHVDLKPLTAVS